MSFLASMALRERDLNKIDEFDIHFTRVEVDCGLTQNRCLRTQREWNFEIEMWRRELFALVREASSTEYKRLLSIDTNNACAKFSYDVVWGKTFLLIPKTSLSILQGQKRFKYFFSMTFKVFNSIPRQKVCLNFNTSPFGKKYIHIFSLMFFYGTMLLAEVQSFDSCLFISTLHMSKIIDTKAWFANYIPLPFGI